MASVTDFGFEEQEKGEEVLHHVMQTNWPKPLMEDSIRVPLRWRLVYEAYNQSIEDLYFRAIDYLQEEESFPLFDKITDIFAASEQSAFFGSAQQRLGLQQDKVSQFLATIGKMVKELFQLVRELRILDERLQIYYESYEHRDFPAEITLKGYWIDLVEGGAKNPASVYGMARELGFVTLPDLFFSAPPMGSSKVEEYVNKLEFNRKVLEVLMRKLKSYLVWKEQTYKELKSRRLFTLKYLRQHYDVIKMYMNWVKPYLRNIERLTMDQHKIDTAHLVSAFEGAMIEIEVLAKRPAKAGEHGGHGGATAYAVYSLHFDYRARPEMKYVQEGYQRGPSHIGRTTFTIRAYAWTQKDLYNYKRFRAAEDFDMLASIDSSVKAAYSALGEDLEKYLREAGEETLPEFAREKKEEERPKLPGLLDPFLAMFRGRSGHGKAKGKGQGKHDEHKCPNCKKTIHGHGPWCETCGHEIRKPTKEEALALKDAVDEAESYCKKHFFNFQKRYKAAYGFVY